MKNRSLFVVDLLRVEKVQVKVVLVVLVTAFFWSAQSGVKPEAVSLRARTGVGPSGNLSCTKKVVGQARNEVPAVNRLPGPVGF